MIVSAIDNFTKEWEEKMFERSFLRWLVDIVGTLLALAIVASLVLLVVRIDPLVEKLLTIIVYFVVGLPTLAVAGYLHSRRWSKSHARKVSGQSPIHWQKPQAFEQKVYQTGLIFSFSGLLSAATIYGPIGSLLRSWLDYLILQFH
jgi:hypothetical protein